MFDRDTNKTHPPSAPGSDRILAQANRPIEFNIGEKQPLVSDCLDNENVDNFRNLQELASEFRVMRNTGDQQAMRDRLAKFFPNMTMEQSNIIACTLCTFFLNDYPWVSAVLLNDRAKFEIYCKCRLRISIGDPPNMLQTQKINKFWQLFQEVYVPVLENVRDSIPKSALPTWCFRGMTLADETDFSTFIVSLKSNHALRKVTSFTSNLECAIKFSSVEKKYPNLLSQQLSR